MAKHRRLNVSFPLGGLDRGASYRQQKPYTTPDCLNVRPYATIEGRERGGSRPGLVRSHITDLGNEIRFLFPMTLSLGDGFCSWSDTFSGLSMSNAWAQAAWSSAIPIILPSASSAIVNTTIASAAVVRDALTIDSSQSYCVEGLLVPWNGEWHGSYSLHLRMNDTTPDSSDEGVIITFTSTGATGAYTATLKSIVGEVYTTTDTATGTCDVAPGWLTVVVSGDVVTVYWQGTSILTGTVDTHAGTRVGFGLDCTVDGGICLCNVFRTQYYTTGSTESTRTLLVASSGGNLYRETFYGQLEQVTTNLTLRYDVQLSVAQSGQKLYIADYGDLRVTGTDGTTAGTSLDATGVADWTTLGINPHDDVVVISNVAGGSVAGTYKIQSVAAGAVTLTETAGTGTCAYRIERGPKVYDPVAGTLSLMTATDGQVPTGCPLICRYVDRIVLAGAEIAPHVWHMARRGDELDWDYSQVDSERAVAGPSSDAGVPGSALIALVPHTDDYLLMGCRHEVWRMRGDPAFATALDSLSRTVGITDTKAWTLGPAGEVVILTGDGVYVIAPGGDSFPEQLSRDKLPREFQNVDPETSIVSMEYDTKDRGVHLFVTQDDPNDRLHWWIDWTGKTFWPVTLSGDHEPTAICCVRSDVIEESGVVLGCRDGILRRFNASSDSDCGTAFTSYVIIGPIGLSEDGQIGALSSIEAVLADDSGTVTCYARTSTTFEAAASDANYSTLSWTAGLNPTDYQCGAGQAFTLQINGTGQRWATENVVVTVRQSGRRRL